MRAKVTKMKRRGNHVMFDVFVEGVKAARWIETSKRVRGKIVVASRVLSADPDDVRDFSGVHIDGYWNGSEVVLNPPRAWQDRDWKPSKKQAAELVEMVKHSEYMVRAVKTLQKTGRG